MDLKKIPGIGKAISEKTQYSDIVELRTDVDVKRNRNSRISKTLAAGSYTIEATTFDAGQTGSFTLTRSGSSWNIESLP